MRTFASFGHFDEVGPPISPFRPSDTSKSKSAGKRGTKNHNLYLHQFKAFELISSLVNRHICCSLTGKPSEDVPSPKDPTQPSPQVVLTNAEQSEQDEQENLSEATKQKPASSWSDVVSRSELRRRKKLEKPVVVAVRKMFPLPSKTVKDDNTLCKDITAATLANEIDSETESTTRYVPYTVLVSKSKARLKILLTEYKKMILKSN